MMNDDELGALTNICPPPTYPRQQIQFQQFIAKKQRTD